jgi:hypothetical protein
MERSAAQLVNQPASTTGRVQPAWTSSRSHARHVVFAASGPLKTRTTKGTSVSGKTSKGSTVSGKQQLKTARGTTTAAPAPKSKGSKAYFNFTGFPFPLGPFFERQTLRLEVSCFRISALLSGKFHELASPHVSSFQQLGNCVTSLISVQLHDLRLCITQAYNIN